jgi:acetylornithine deacetylase/succinyl-diaminopimelate desuccinylase-like protein
MSDLSHTVSRLMPEMRLALDRLVRIPSIAFPDFPPEPLFEAHDAVVDLLHAAGVSAVDELTIEGKTAPVVIAEVAGPEGSPTVLFYTHYDVVPAGDESLWHTPPFEPIERDGAIYGRGTADSKANLVSIVTMLRIFGANPPATIRVVFEGQEEYGSPFDYFPSNSPERFAAEAMVIADVGSVRPGVPTLTVALRGSAGVTVEATTLGGDKHSGQFGGAAPDARVALVTALASLFDDSGNVAVEGLMREPWWGVEYDDDEFRTLAEVVDGIGFQGTGGLGERLWSGPAITIVGFDAPPVDAPLNAVAAHARAALNLRVHPRQDVHAAQDALVAHLEAARPFGVPLTVTRGEAGNGFAGAGDGPASRAARAALREAWGIEAVDMASGGSIPLVMSLQQAAPAAEILMFGSTDGYSNIHAPNERVLLTEFEAATVAKVEFVERFAREWTTSRSEEVT